MPVYITPVYMTSVKMTPGRQSLGQRTLLAILMPHHAGISPERLPAMVLLYFAYSPGLGKIAIQSRHWETKGQCSHLQESR